MSSTEEKDDFSWCNKEFLKIALKHGGFNPNLSVVHFKIGHATASGDNYMSEMFRVHVKTQDKYTSDETSIIIKSTPIPEKVRQMVSDFGLFQREIEAYTKVLPQFHNMLEEAAPGKYQPFAAKCLYHQDVPCRTVMVLEDLKTKDFRMAERLSGFDLQHTLLAIRSLARFHGISVVLYRKDPEFVEPFRDRYGSKDEAQRKIQDDYFAASLRSLADEIETWPSFNQYSDRLRKLANNCKDKLYEVTKSNEDEFNVLNHGDFWLNNMMFRYDINQLKDIRFVDFQMQHWTSPVIDLQYFLNTSLNVNLWDKQDYFLEEYHKELGETLQLFNLEHVQPTLQELHSLMEKRAFFSLYVVAVIAPFVLKDPENFVPLNDLILDGGQENVTQKSMYSGSSIQATLKKHLPIYAQKQLF